MLNLSKISPMIKTFIGLLILGFLISVQRWPYGNLIMVCACAAIVLGHTVEVIRNKNRSLTHYLSLGAVVCACTYWVLLILHYPYKFLFGIGALVFFIAYYFMDRFTNKESKAISDQLDLEEDTPSKITFYNASFVIIILGALFKILHFPGGDLLLVIGLIIVGISMVITLFKK